jgi:hypothetical protein
MNLSLRHPIRIALVSVMAALVFGFAAPHAWAQG